MSVSLQQDSEQRSKATKRPPPGRKKALCAQKEAEPPPGFGGHAPKKNGEGLKKKRVDREPTQDVCVGDQKAIETASPASDSVIMSESWPSLTLPSAFSEPVQKKNRQSTTSRSVEKRVESSVPITPPPGYARHPPNPPPAAAKRNPEKEAFEHLAPATKSENSAFPPLPPKTKSSSSVLPLSSKSVGGSKVFEDIRKALDYDTAKFKDFQSNSGWFRSGVLSIKEYDAQCKELFGPRWVEIGPLIAKVMPQGKKRDELVGMFASRGVAVGAPEKLTTRRAKKSKQTKQVPNAWLGEGEGGGGVEGGASGGANRRVVNRGVSEDEYPSLSVASKLPHSGKSSSSNVWKVSVH